MRGIKLGPSKGGALGILLLSAVAVYFLFQIRVDNRHELMLDDTSEAARTYDRFLEQFGSDEFVVVALSGKPLFELESLAAMSEGLERIESVPHVDHVTGIPSIFRDRFGGEDPEALEEEMTTTPFYTGLLLSEDEETAGLIVQTRVLDGPSARRELVSGLREAVAPLEQFGFRVDLVGAPIFDETLNRLSMRESMRMFPLAAMLSLFVLVWLLRSAKAVAVVLFCGVITLILTIGGIIAVGRTLNIVTTSLPLILWVLALANSIHIAVRYQRYVFEGLAHDAAAAKALDELRFSCSLSSITTAMGFLSLIVADIGPIRELGVYMASGMLVSLVVNLVLCPFLLTLFKAPAPSTLMAEKHAIMDRISSSVTRWPWPIIAAFAVLVLGGAYSATQLQSEPDSLRFLPDDSQAVRSHDFVSEHLTGLSSLEMVLETPGTWLNPEYWPAIERIAAAFERYDYVGKVLTPLEFLKKINQWNEDLDPESYRLPETEAGAHELMDLLEEEDRIELSRYISPDDERIRISVLVNTRRSDLQDHLEDVALEQMAELPDPLSGEVTGIVSRMQEMSTRLVDTQYRSYSVAFLLVFVTLFVGLRSVWLTLLSIVPNMIPILSAFTAMALLDIGLDAATVMVASISLGIAVDDTVHFLAGYAWHRIEGHSNQESIRATISKVGSSITVTTFTACIGFFTLAFSDFIPISYFGLLSGIAILMALCADLFLLPAMLVVRGENE